MIPLKAVGLATIIFGIAGGVVASGQDHPGRRNAMPCFSGSSAHSPQEQTLLGYLQRACGKAAINPTRAALWLQAELSRQPALWAALFDTDAANQNTALVAVAAHPALKEVLKAWQASPLVRGTLGKAPLGS